MAERSPRDLSARESAALARQLEKELQGARAAVEGNVASMKKVNAELAKSVTLSRELNASERQRAASAGVATPGPSARPARAGAQGGFGIGGPEEYARVQRQIQSINALERVSSRYVAAEKNRATILEGVQRRSGGSYGALAGSQVRREGTAAARAEADEAGRLLQREVEILAAKKASVRATQEAITANQRETAQRAAQARIAREGGRVPASDYARAGATQIDPLRSPAGIAASTAAQARAYGSGREIRGFTSDLQRVSVVQAEASQQMRRHGALTTEFLGALARGETTLSEFRFQIGSTIGKFAGWTAAAGAVYGALGAVNQLYQGAIKGASGVGLLHRVMTTDLPGGAEELQTRFRDLSKQFNLPIDDVVQAAYGSAKAFGGDLPQALKASESALFGVKVGELSAADSTRFLTAIVNGFKLEANQLPNVFDAINQAQNRFGGSLRDVIAGVAKAGGAFHEAGGGYRELIALIEAGVKLTGTSGENVGTAIARSAGTVLTPQGQKRLADAGLDPSLKYPQLLAQAFAKSQGASRERVSEIARALVPAGGQFARVFVPLLRNVELYNRVMKNISPEQAKGSAMKELKKALSQPDEQLKSLANGLQRLGLVLAQTGAFNGLGVMVHLLNLSLSSVEKMLSLFNQIVPKGIRPWVVGLGEVYALSRLIQRSAIGEGLATRTGVGFLGSQTAATRRGALIPARQTQQQLANLAEQRANQAATSYATGRASAQMAAQLRAEAQMATDSTRQVALLQESEAASQQSARARASGLVAEREALLYQQESVAMQRDITALQKKKITAQQFAQRQGGAVIVPGGGAAAAGARAAADQDAAAASFQTATREASGLIVPAEVENNARKNAAASGEEATKAKSRAARIKASASQVKAASGRFASATSEYISGMGLMSKALGTFFIGSILVDALKEATRKVEEQTKDLATTPADLAELRARANNPQRVDRSLAFKVAGAAIDVPNYPLVRPFGIGSIDPNRDIKKAEADAQKLDKSVLDARRRTFRSPVQTVGLNFNEIYGRARKDADLFRRGVITRDQFMERYSRIQRDEKVSLDAIYNGTGTRAYRAGVARNRALYLQALRSAGPSASDPLAQFRGQGQGELTTYLGTEAERAGPQGLTNRRAETLARGLAYAAYRYGGRSDAKSIASLQAAMKGYSEAITGEAQRVLQAGLQDAVTPGQRNTAYQAAINVLVSNRRRLQGGLRNINQEVTDAEARIKDYQREANKDRGTRLGERTREGGDTNVAALAAYKKRIENAKRRRGLAKRQIEQQERALRELEDQLREQQFTDATQARQTRLTYLQSQTQDPTLKAAEAVRSAGQQVRAALAYRGPGRWQKIMEALTQQNDAIAAETQAQLGRLQSYNRLAVSRISTPGPEGDLARQREGLAGARRELGLLKQRGANPDDIRNAMANINELQRGVAELARQNAEALRTAKFNAALANITDPVARDRAQLRFDKGALSRQKRGSIAYFDALAKVRQDKTQLQQDDLTSDLDDLRFRHEMDQLSTDSYIDSLRSLLTRRNLTKQQRREIMLQIHQLEQESEQEAQGFNLDLGSIKLPTAYDVKTAWGFARNPVQAASRKKDAIESMVPIRDIGGGAVPRAADVGAAAAGASVYAPVTVYVTDAKAAPEVYNAIDRALRTGVKAKARKARVR